MGHAAPKIKGKERYREGGGRREERGERGEKERESDNNKEN